MIKTILLNILMLGIALVLLSFWGFYTAINPFRIMRGGNPSNFGLKYENISFVTKDGVTIKGWFLPATQTTTKTIILLHGYPADKSDILPSRIFLHRDFNLLFFDFRYLGESGGNYSTVGKDEVLDLLAAINYLKKRNITAVGVWGFSMGASVAMMTAPQAPEIKAIVAESPYARLDWLASDYYRIPILKYPLGYLTKIWVRLFLHYDISTVNPADVAKEIKIPILLIYSAKDELIQPKHGDLLKESLSQNPQLEVIYDENVVHGEPIKNYQQIVSNFFKKNL